MGAWCSDARYCHQPWSVNTHSPKVILRWREEGSLANRRRRGRPRVTTPQQDEEIIAASTADPKKASLTITRELHLPCTPQTTRRRLREREICCHVPAVKEELKEWHRDTRLGFALHLVDDIDFWKNVIFSDETHFTSVEPRARHVCDASAQDTMLATFRESQEREGGG
nr:uncharacterized protein LOC113811745 [Penaeus vannamei]